MTDHASLLRQIHTEARPYVEQLVELNTVFTGFRKLATANGLDWGQIKALLRAEIEDGEEGGSEKVDRIIKKAEFAGEYATLLGLGSANMNNSNSIYSDGEPSDRNKGRTWTNEAIDPITGEISDETAAPTPWSRESEREYLASLDDGGIPSADPDLAPLPPHDGETGELIEEPASVPSETEAGQGGLATGASVAPPPIPEPEAVPRAVKGETAPVSGDALGQPSVGTTSASPNNSECSGGAEAARRAHNPEVVGASPTPATTTSDADLPRASDGCPTKQETDDPIASEGASAHGITGKSSEPSHNFDDLEPPPFLKRGDPACAVRQT